MFEREKNIAIIQNYFKDKPVKRVWLFGSYARGEQSKASDIDLLVTFTNPISLLTYSGYMVDLQELLEIPIDLVEEGTLYPRVAKEVEKEKILIYERNT